MTRSRLPDEDEEFETTTSIPSRRQPHDLVVDDASHINTLTLASFQILLPLLRPNGFYFIEDLGMSYVDLSAGAADPHFMLGSVQANIVHGVDVTQKRADLDELFQKLLLNLDMNRGQLRFLHFWSKLAILQKGPASGKGSPIESPVQ